jgi:hypothetical protein
MKLFLIAFSILVIPAVVIAQTALPLDPAVAGQWAMSIKVTKGNEKDQSRIGSGGTMKSAQNGANVICRG